MEGAYSYNPLFNFLTVGNIPASSFENVMKPMNNIPLRPHPDVSRQPLKLLNAARSIQNSHSPRTQKKTWDENSVPKQVRPTPNESDFQTATLLRNIQNSKPPAETDVSSLQAQLKVTKHKHRKGMSCPRCKLERELKNITKRQSFIARAQLPKTNPVHKKRRVMKPKPPKVSEMDVPAAEKAILAQELARVDELIESFQLSSTDEKGLQSYVHKIKGQIPLFKHRHHRGTTCPKCKLVARAKEAEKVLHKTNSTTVNPLSTYDSSCNFKMSGLLALADLAALQTAQ